MEISGGLGNQMFQYLMGRKLAIKNETDLYLNVEAFKEGNGRNYQLDAFNISEVKFIYKKNVRKLIAKRKFERFFKKVILKRNLLTCIREACAHTYDEKIEEAKSDVYLMGYWQGRQYVENSLDIVNKEFKFREVLDSKNEEIFKAIEKTESVSIHFRRGDFVSNPVYNEVHGVLGLNYYYKGLNYILERHAGIRCFIFSDDIGWVRNNFRVQAPCFYVDLNDERNCWKDLQLMSTCKHNIIANSSFGWWGGFLNKNKNKIVIAPECWYNKRNSNHNLIPLDWMQI